MTEGEAEEVATVESVNIHDVREKGYASSRDDAAHCNVHTMETPDHRPRPNGRVDERKFHTGRMRRHDGEEAWYGRMRREGGREKNRKQMYATHRLAGGGSKEEKRDDE